MSAYATPQRHLQTVPTIPTEPGLIDALISQLADQITSRVLQQLTNSQPVDDDWLDSRHAADYLGVHRDTLRKLAAEQAIPSEQDGRGCKLYFRRSDLGSWRQSGGRPHHLTLAA